MPEPRLWHFHDVRSGTLSHLVACPDTRRAVLIDPVLGFDPGPARIDNDAAQEVAAVIRGESLVLEWVLETHIHADHVTAAQFFKQQFGARVGIGVRARAVQRLYAPIFDLTHELVECVPSFDRLWQDEERFSVGNLQVQVLSTPGHTLDGVTYCIGNHAFVGDTVFRADFGTARTDLVGGDAAALFASICRLYALPADTTLHFCHDYPRDDAAPTERSSVEQMRRENVHLSCTTQEEEFVALRRARDATLSIPDLLIAAVQINIAAGCLPAAGSNGIAYLRTPLNIIDSPHIVGRVRKYSAIAS
jgi:glyoxylase-like metal-dependent hydrolase (beta-lactamase superfamily II)